MDFGQRKTIRRYILCCTLLGVFFVWAFSSVKPVNAATGTNQTLNFQGRLLNAQGATVPDGYYNIQFKIYQDGDGQSVGNATGSPAGTLKWTESYLNANSQGVRVQNGFLSVQLGSVTPFGSSVDWNQDTLWLSMNIGNTNTSCTPFTSCSPDGEMTPMQPMTSAVYALNASRLNGLTASAFAQLAANQTWTGDNIFRPATNSTTAFQLQNSTSGLSYMTGDSTNNQLVLGVASSLNGKLAFATAGGGVLTVVPTSTASNYTLTLPAETGTICTTGSICAGYASTTSLSGYVQLQGSSPGTVQTGNINISGTGIFGGSLSVGGSSTFTGNITANGGLVVTTGQSITVNGDAVTDLTGSGLTLSSGALTVDATSATGFFRNGGNSFGGSANIGTNDSNILTFKTNNSEVARFTTGGALQIGSTGTTGTVEKFRVNTPGVVDNAANTIITAGSSTNKALVLQGAASQSAVLLEVQSSTGTSLALIGGDGVIQGASLKISSGVGGGYLAKNYTVGTGGVAANDVVVLANDGGNSRAVTTTTARDTRVMGVALTSASSGGLTGIAYSGNFQVTATTAAVAIGDQLVTSTTAGQVMTDNNATTGIVGYATSAKSAGSSGLVSVYLNPSNGQTNPNFGGNVGINIQGTAPTNRLNINAATTADAAAQALISTGSTGNKGLVVQRVSGQTANLIEVQSDTGSVLVRFSSGGVLGINNNSVGTQSKLSINPNSITDNSAVAQINTVNTTDKGLIIQGVSGQTANLFEIEGSTGNTILSVGGGGGLRVATGVVFNNAAVSVGTGAATNPGIAIRGVASQTADLFQFQDSAGLVNSSFNGTGNQLTLGRIASSGTVTQGKLLFADGTTDNYSLTLQSATLSNNQTITFPNETGTVCTTGSVCSGYVGTTTLAGYVQLQATTPGTAQTGNLNISGTGIFGGAVTAGAGTTISGGAISLNVSSNNNTNINTGNSSGSVAIGNANNTLTVNSATTNFSGNAPSSGHNAGVVVNGSLTSATTGQFGLKVVPGLAPTSSSAYSYYGLFANPSTSSANVASSTLTGIYGGVFTDAASLSKAVGGEFGITNFGVGDVGTAKGIQVNDIDNGAGTVNYGVGVNILEQSQSTNNTNLLIGTGTAPSGNWSIYSSGSYNSAIAGSLRIGSTTAPTATLDVTGTAKVSSTLAVTGLTTASGGLTATGSTNINTTGTAATTIGNTGATVAIASSGLNVTTAGAVSGVTTLVTSSTINTNTLTATALTFSGANPVISSSTSNTGLTLQSNGSGTLTLNTSGAGTVNVGTANTTTVGIGNSGSTNTILGTTNLNTTGTAASSIGNTSGTLALQGGASSTFVANNGANKTTLAFASPSAVATVTVPNETGIICTTAASAACTAVYASAGGTYVNLQSTTPGTQQTGNLNISGVGILGGGLTVSAGGAAITGTTTINTTGTAATTIGNTGATVAIASSGLNVTTAGAVSGVTTLVTSSTINTNTLTATALTFSGANPVISSSTSNTGLTLQSNGSGTLTLNSSGAGTVNVGTTNTTAVNVGSSNATLNIQGQGATTGTIITAFRVAGDTNDRFNIAANGTLNWGSGSAGTDVTLFRNSSGQLSSSSNVLFTNTLNVGSSAVTGTKFGVKPGASTTGIVVQGSASQASNLFELQDNNSNVNASFNGAGNQLTLGRIASSGTVTQGKLLFSDGTTDNFSLTLQSATLSGSQVITLPNETGTVCTTGSVCAGYASASGYVQLQGTTPGSAQTGNINVTGTILGGVLGVNTSTFGTAQKFGVNTAATVDNAAAAVISTGATGNKGLLIQGVSGQSNNLLELQSYDGTFLMGANSSGQIGLSVNPGAGVGAKLAVSTAGIGFNSETTSTNDNTRLVLNNTTGIQTNGLLINRSGTGGTTTNLLNLTNTAGTATNGLQLTGTFTNLINATNFSVTNGGFLYAALDVVSGNGQFRTYGSASGSSNSTAIDLHTGDMSGTSTGTSGSITVRSGNNTNTGGSGNVIIDSGSATSGVTGSISLGATNSTALTIGNTGANTTTLIQGGSSSTAIQINQGLGGTISIGTTGSGSTVNLLCGASATCGIANNATTHNTVLGSTSTTSATTVQAGSGGITLTGNISASGTYNSNTFSSTALTFAGVNPVIGASTTNTGMTLQANGSGTLTLNTTGAGTVNLGTTNTTTIGIGNSGSTNTILGATTLTGTVNINNSGTATTTIGAGTGTGGNVVIQGGAGSSFGAQNTSGTSVLNFAAPSTSGIVTFQLPTGGTGGQTYQVCTTLSVCSGYSASGSFANTSLSNLSSVAINTSLLPASNNAIDAGSSTLNFANGYFGTSVRVPLVSSADTTAASTASAATIFRSGNTSGATSGSGNVTLQSGNVSTSGNSGSVTIDSGSTASGTTGTVSVGATNSRSITVGNTSATTQTLIQGGSGGTAVSVQAATNGTINIGTTNANGIYIGATNNTNAITIGQSTDAAGETVNIANGATTGNNIVAILSGSGSAGAATLRLGNNTRVTTIDLGNARPAAARTINIGNSTATANTVVDTINIATNPTTVANGNTVNIASGTPTGSGTNTVTIGSTVGGSTTLIQGGANATGIQILQGTGGQVIVGSANTGSTVTVQCGAGTSSNCGFGTNGNDHSTYMGSTTGVSNTVIQSGTGGINLNGAITTSSTINGVTLNSTTLTFSGANPVISASTTNTGMTVQSNGSGTLTLNSTGAGTVNVGTTNTTTIGIGNTTAATQTSIQGGTGASALSMQVGAGGTISLGTTSQTTTLNVGNTSASTVTTIQGGTSTTALNLQVGNGGSLNIGTTAQTSVLNLGNTSASATTLINGGTGSTAIQLLQGTGGTITIGGTGAASVVNIQCGAGTSTACGFGTNATDHTTTFGSVTGVSLTTIQAGTGGIALAQNTTLAAGKSLTMASGTGQFTQAYTGTTTDAHAITATSLTSGTAFKVTSSNNTAANTSWTGTQFNATNAQSTTAATGYLYGTDFEFTQAATVAGNNESAVNIAVAATSGSPVDNTVSSILNIANNDDATGNLVQATDAIKITATTANNIINGINFNGTIQTNLIYTSSNNYTVTAGGAVTQAGNLTLTGANPTISATSTNANLTLQTNGTGTLAIATTGAGTINVGTTNTTTIGIGNTTAATQTLIQGGTGSTALGLQVGTGGTISIGTNVAGTTNVGTVVGAAATSIYGGTGANAVSIQSGAGGTLSLGTTNQTSTLAMGNTSASSTTSISGGTGATAVQILQGAGGTVTIGGTGTNSVVSVQCGASTSTACGFANNATDHTTTIGSATGASLTAIQGGTSGITLTSGNTVETILTSGSTIKTNSNSTTAFRVVNSSNFAVLSVDTNAAGTNNTLRIMDGTATGAYLGLAYNSGTSTGTIAASTGTTAVGSGTGAISVLAGASSAITITANATSLWRTTAGTLTMQSGTSSDLILTSGSGIVQISGSSVVKMGTSAGDPGTCTAGAIVYNTTTNTLRGCQGSTLAWNDLINLTIPTMQQTYTASTGGTTPEVKLDTTRAAFDIQGDNAGAVTTLLNVRAGTGSGLGTAVVSVASNGTATFQSSSSQDLMLVDATALEIQIGSGTAHSTDAVKLVLDNFQSETAGAEPSATDGAMYFDADSNQFRCSARGFWSSCAINSIESSYVFEDEFLSGATQTAAATSLHGVGALGWNVSTTTSCAVAYNQNVTGTGPGVQHDHPGTLRLTTNTSNGAACVLTQGGTAAGSPTLNQVIDQGDTFKSAIAVGTATGFMRVGWSNQSAAGAPTSGAWWQYTGGNLQYCYANNAAAVCATATTLAVNTWAEVEIHVNSVTAGAVNITFTSSIAGVTTSNTTTANFDPGTTNRLTPGGSCVNNTTTAQNCYIDYIQWSGYNTSGTGIRD